MDVTSNATHICVHSINTILKLSSSTITENLHRTGPNTSRTSDSSFGPNELYMDMDNYFPKVTWEYIVHQYTYSGPL